MAANYSKETHARNQRRRARQMLGLLVAVLAFLGVVSILHSGMNALNALFDDSSERADYANRIEGFVLFDPLPFEGIANCDDLTLREAAVWGTVGSILDTETGFTNYDHDPETDMVLLPTVEVDAYLAKVIGPEFKMTHQTFTMDDMTITYDENMQSYLIPVTGSVGAYDTIVVRLFKQGGKLHVTAGYIPTNNTSELSGGTSTEPTKYMDYIFSRTSGNWYLTGVTESDTKAPAASATPAPSAIVAESGTLEEAILAGVSGEEAGAQVADSAASAETASAEGEGDSAAA